MCKIITKGIEFGEIITYPTAHTTIIAEKYSKKLFPMWITGEWLIPAGLKE